ncbi:MAG: hypothetical protein AAF487_00915 [Bacteroidota bacterium]
MLFWLSSGLTQTVTQLSDHASPSPMDIAVANNGSIQVLKGGAGQMYNPNDIPIDNSILNSVIMTIGTTEIGQQGPGNFGYLDHDWDNGTVSGVSGSGTYLDPWEITAFLTSSSYAGAGVNITYSYVNGREYFDVSLTPTLPAANSQFVKVYHCIDTYLNGSDDGAAYTLGPSPHVFMGVEATTGGLYEGFIVGNDPWEHFSSEHWSTMLSQPADGDDLSDNLDFNSNTDNGIAVQWDLGNVAGSQPTITYKLSFTSNIPLPVEVCGNGVDDNIDGRIDEEYPGGVEENILLWVKADEGFSGSGWTDLSPHNNDGTHVNSPVNLTSINYNPAADYDGSNYTTFPLPELVFDSGNNHITLFMVYYPDDNSTTQGVFGNQAAGLNNITLADGALGNGNFTFVSETNLFGNSPKILRLTIDEEDNVAGMANGSSAYLNGILLQTFSFDENFSANVDSNFHIGKGGSNVASLFYDGKIMECIIYFNDDGGPALQSGQIQQVESYLSVKYGIEYNADYLGSQ